MQTSSPATRPQDYVESTLIASKFTVRQYRGAVANKDRDAVAEAIRRRFTERYIDPALNEKSRHGFTQVAIACLMLEALESFLRGWKKSIHQSEKLFVEFLEREPDFATLIGRGSEFFTNVRCGILHQAETTAGWRIGRRGDLFDGNRTINADKFIRALQKVLNSHCDALKRVSWGDKRWNAARRKLDHICDNCRP
jgi:hypothetical protein